MRTIGIISDTHGLLRPEAEAALRGSELILHAGDVGDPRILEALSSIAPVHAVFGNTDYGEMRTRLPRTALVDLGAPHGKPARTLRPDAGPAGEPPRGGTLAYVHHGDRELDLDPAAAGISMVVSGHTHRPLVEWREGVLHLNPGSAGPRRFTLPATVARVTLDGPGQLRAEIVDLTEPG